MYFTYGFRFQDTMNEQFCQLFSTGYDDVRDHGYRWNGMIRVDGPLLLFQYTVAGEGGLVLNGQTFKVKAGQALMVTIPGDHEYFLPEESERCSFYFMLMRPYQIEAHWNKLLARIGPVPCIEPDSPAVSLLKSIWQSARSGGITDGFQASALVYRFMMELIRSTEERRLSHLQWPPKIRAAAERMQADYASPLTLDELAAAAGLSKYYFTRSFKEAAGCTPGDYLAKIRMKHAVRLLRQTPATVEEVAARTGYASTSYFIKVFRRWVGFSPGEFRGGRGVASSGEMTFD